MNKHRNALVVSTTSASAIVNGNAVALDTEGGTITVSAPGGVCLLKVALTAEGPVLQFESAAIEMAASRVAIKTDRFELAAREARVAIAGDLHEQVGGDVARLAGGTSSLSGRDVHIDAPIGEVRVHASDDVDVRGERVRLNCDDPPMPLSFEEHRERLRRGSLEPRILRAAEEA